MYKTDVVSALKRLRLIPGGTVAGLLEFANAAQEALEQALVEVAANNDQSVRAGRERVQVAIRPLHKRISGISPSGTAIELHQLGANFDLVLRDFPQLEPVIRPGRQALAQLAGAFDVAIQQNKSPPSLIGLIQPSMLLANCYLHYEGLEAAFAESALDGSSGRISATIEIAGIDSLGAFAAYVGLLSYLASVANELEAEIEPASFVHESGISIASIESGSPIRITLAGASRAVIFLLTMVRDVVRVPYQYLTPHGRAVQSMEIFAKARELGIDSPEVLGNLDAAMIDATQQYATKIKGRDVVVSINGKPEKELTAIEAISLVELPLYKTDHTTHPALQKLPSPKDEE